MTTQPMEETPCTNGKFFDDESDVLADKNYQEQFFEKDFSTPPTDRPIPWNSLPRKCESDLRENPTVESAQLTRKSCIKVDDSCMEDNSERKTRDSQPFLWRKTIDLPNELGDVVNFVASMAKKLDEGTSESPTRFHSVSEPSVPIDAYVRRIAQCARCSPQCYVLALIYIDKVLRGDGPLRINKLTIHRLFITAITIATKFHDDQYYSNRTMAKIGGISVKELNAMEVEFVFHTRFDLCVSEKCYAMYRSKLKMFKAE